MKQQAKSITMLLPGENRRSFDIGDTMESGKIIAIEVDGSTFTLICEKGNVKYANIPFVAKIKNQ